jgi:hypothetical protein
MVVLLISYPQLHRNIRLPAEPDFTNQVPVKKLARKKRNSKLIDYRAAPNSCPHLRRPMAGTPGVTAVIDDIVAGFEDSVREPVDVRDNDDIGGSHLSCRQMQSGLIDDGDSTGFQCGALGRVPRLAHLRLMFFQFMHASSAKQNEGVMK